MKRWLVSGLAVSLAACTPDISTGPDISANFAEAEFDPAHGILPLPNDLAFIDPATGQFDTKLHAPTTGGSDAQNEFNRDYLNLLDGFPMDSTASVLFSKPIDLSTVNPGVPTPPVPGIAVVYPTTGTSDTLSIGPPAGGWLRGHRYAMAVIGGSRAVAVKGANNTIVTKSPTFALISQSQPLITCDANGTNCVLATSAIPTTSKDPATAKAEQIATAKQLEALRLTYAPLIAALGGPPLNVNAGDIALLWTFTITSQAEVTFDPLNNAIPFPNDILLDQTTGKVSIPASVPLPPDLVAGLNTLDGFSTTGMIISEFGPDTGPLLQGRLPGTSYTLSPAGPINLIEVPGSSKGAPPAYDLQAHACVNCPPINMVPLPDGGVKPDTLAIVPDVPLTERTQYAAYITTDLKDGHNINVIPSPIFALARSSTPLFDGTHSTVSVLSDGRPACWSSSASGSSRSSTTWRRKGCRGRRSPWPGPSPPRSTITTLTQLNAIPQSGRRGNPWGPALGAGDRRPRGRPGHQRRPLVHRRDHRCVPPSRDRQDVRSAHRPRRRFPSVMSVPMGSAAPPTGWPTTIFGLA
jgi:hypothetical protein